MPKGPAWESPPPGRKILKRIFVDPRHLEADRQQLAAIVDDLRRCGGLYAPVVNWMRLDPGRSREEVDDGRPYLDQSFSDESIANRMSTMGKMLAAWIGDQRQSVNPDVVARYAPYLMAHDPLGLWTANVANADMLSKLMVADLASMLDVSIICSFSSTVTAQPAAILDVGAGYGRLAEAALNVFGTGVKYVLVDSVPASLLYARDYLRKVCDWARIGFYYDGDPFDLNKFDCYIAPSWHFETINNVAYDVCINVESFQEMGQAQVDAYLAWFQEMAREGALIYISNAHDYIFRGEWNYPVTWQRLLCARTPRSWTADHRTEVFIKGNRDYSSANAAIVAAYKWNLAQQGSSRVAAPLSLAKWLRESPIANTAKLPRRVIEFRRKQARIRSERCTYESLFERAVAGEERAQREFESYWEHRQSMAECGGSGEPHAFSP